MAGLSRIIMRSGAIIARGMTDSAHRCSPMRCAPRRKHSTRKAYSIRVFSLTHDASRCPFRKSDPTVGFAAGKNSAEITTDYRKENTMSAEVRLKEMGLVLPVLQKPVA